MRPPYPKQFRYKRASSLEEAVDYVEQGAKPLAGGQSLSILLKLRLAEVEELVDIFGLDELRYFKVDGDVMAVGALVVHNDIAMAEEIAEWAPALRKAAWHIADLQVRNRGTIGGSLAHADPAANYIPVLVALDATVLARGKASSRAIRAEELVKGPYQTALDREIITEVRIPKWSRQAFHLVKRAGASYPSLVLAAAAQVEDGVIVNSRIAIGGFYLTPVVVKGALDGLSVSQWKEGVAKTLRELPEGTGYSDFQMDFEKKRHALPQALEVLLKELAEPRPLDLPVRKGLTYWRPRPGNTIVVNGKAYEVDVEPRVLLIDLLRRLGVTEVKRGCDEGKCGACTVLMDGRAVKSCTIFAHQAIGHEISTVKALMSGGSLHYIQRAFLEEYASQCGYCTHGFIMAVYDYLSSVDPKAGKDSLKLSIKNICRCTGYVNIVKAIRRAATYINNTHSKSS